MQENQQVVFMFDGGEDVRQVQEYLHPNSEHILDWFHITMRVTVLQQQTKALQAEATGGDGVSKQIDSVKHLLWHGNVAEAPERLASLFLGLDLMRKRSAPAEKLAAGIAEFETYIRNNRESIPKFGERYRQGETISTAFVESTINQVVSRRFVKNSRCNGRLAVRTCYCRPARKFSTANWTKYSGAGTRDFARSPKPTSRTRWLDPRVAAALHQQPR
jgi:hypothetical protein